MKCAVCGGPTIGPQNICSVDCFLKVSNVKGMKELREKLIDGTIQLKGVKIDSRAVEIAEDLLARLKSKKAVSSWYFDGYHQAICDFISYYVGVELRDKEFDSLNDEAIKYREVKK